MWRNDFEKARSIEDKSKISIDWKDQVTQADIACQVCEKEFETVEEFTNHVERDWDHYTMIDKYLLKDFE